LELLRPLGIEQPRVEFGLVERPRDALAAEGLLRELFGCQAPASSRSAADAPPRFSLINPGAGWPSKIWPAERFADVARRLGRERGVPSIVVWASDKERAAACAIVAQSDGHAHLAPATSLCELAALARRAALFVSADTGPLHLAVAVGTPSVGLFGPMPVERNGPYGAPHIGIQKATITGGSRERRNADDATMRAIGVDDVVAACGLLLNREASRRQCA
jgi:ADP-heptose:LPS heptosyltransferase